MTFPSLPLNERPRYVGDAEIASVSASKLRAGSLSVAAFVRSSNYVAATSGWQIEGDGAADFSGTVTVGGSLSVGGSITLTGTGSIATASSGERVTLQASDAAAARFYSGLSGETAFSQVYTEAGKSATRPRTVFLGPTTASTTAPPRIHLTDVDVLLSADGGETVQIAMSGSGVNEHPLLVNDGDTNTGIGWGATDVSPAADELRLYAGGTARMRMTTSGVEILISGTDKLISQGATDSGGSGFRVLRVPN